MEFIPFFIVIILTIIAIFILFFVILPRIMIKDKEKNKIEEVKKTYKKIDGILEECIVFKYNEISNGEKKTRYIYLPVVSYRDESGNKNLITCGKIEDIEFIAKGVFRYKDIGKTISINIDENNISDIILDLEQGYFLNKKYTEYGIDIGDTAEARRGIFVDDREKIYLMEYEHDLREYIKKVKIAPGIITMLNEKDYIEETVKNTKKAFKIVGGIIMAIVLITTIPIIITFGLIYNISMK